MNISKLLRRLLAFYAFGVMDTSGGGSESALDTNQAAAEFATIFGGDEPIKEQESSQEDPDAAAIEALQAEESAPESEEEGEQPQKFTVKIDGKDVEVTRDELLSGYQRQADYTRKTMEAAEARKAAETEANAARQERQQYAQNLQNVQQQLGSVLQEQSQIDWQQLLETDPVEYLKQKDLFERRQTALYQTQQEQQRVWQQQQAEQQSNVKRFLEGQREELLAKLPEWKDEGKMKAEREELKSFLRTNAFSDEEINSIADHRHVLMARKAMQYDRLIEKAKAASKKVQTLPPKVERPGVTQSGNVDKRSQSFQRLAKSGRVEDAAAAFRDIL
jgi:hypothetical protein